MTQIRSLTTSSASVGYPATNVYSFRAGRRFAALGPDWQLTVEARLQELIRLETGWDGYEAPPVGFGNAVFAVRVLESICIGDTPAPSIVPGNAGDVQLEWHLPGGEIELHVGAPNDVHAWRCLTGTHPLEESIVLSTDFSVVAMWLRDLTEAPLAPHAAAA